MNSLYNISSIDGRYNETTEVFHKYFSEFGLIKYRVLIEIEYLIFLNNYKLMEPFTKEEFTYLFTLHIGFNLEDAKRVKEIESITKHDVKAIEYFIKEKLESHPTLKTHSHFIHLGLTSQDINSSANMLSMKHGIEHILIPYLTDIFKNLVDLSDDWKSIPILSHTHGQPASPSLLGKEILVFVERLHNQLSMLKTVKYTTKFGGAVGNFNSLVFSLPHINWIEFADKFVKILGLERNIYTTQIDHYDNYAVIFDTIKRINTILIDLCQDIWYYISMNYFCLKIVKGEVGSSAMPHKVNPINFENAEGNLLLANNTFNFLSDKLPKSRLQRDLTDSTILRNIGLAFSYCMIGYTSLHKGLLKLEVNNSTITEDLKKNYVVVAEAIQTKLKLLGIHDSYEKIKDITRTNTSDVDSLKLNLQTYIHSLDIAESDKNDLLLLTPFNYTGCVPKHSF